MTINDRERTADTSIFKCRTAAEGQRSPGVAKNFESCPCGHSALTFTGGDHRAVVVAVTNGVQSSRDVKAARSAVGGRVYRTEIISAVVYRAGEVAGQSAPGTALKVCPCGHSLLPFVGVDHRAAIVAVVHGFQSSQDVRDSRPTVDGRMCRTDITGYRAGKEAVAGQRSEVDARMATGFSMH